MKLFRRLKRLWHSVRHETVALRRYDAAKTDRLNEARWTEAGDQHLNSDLTIDLDTLRQRILVEIENNPFLEGVVQTHVTDVVGDRGPSLQVISENEKFNAALEAGWKAWWRRPDYNGQYSGVDLLDLAVRQLWTCGSWLWQKLTADTRLPVKLRLLEIHPRRMSSPYGANNQDNIVLGVERNETGRPIAYYVREALPGELNAIAGFSLNTRRIDARNAIHRFRRIEANQVDGVPWLAPSLQIAADVRDFDTQVLDAARAAADNMILLHSNHEDAPFFEVNESTEYQRRQIRTLPPGWDAKQMKSEQPTTNYVDYRRERHREIGRPVGMPGMLVRLDSSQHNFSSARFDAKQYVRGLRKLQTWMDDGTLDELLDEVRLELELPPEEYVAEWTWPLPEFSGDPGRDANADDTRLKNLSATLREILGNRGKDFQSHVEQLKREIAELEPLGILHPAQMEQLGRVANTAGNVTAGNAARAELQDLVRDCLDEVLAEHVGLQAGQAA
jgi:lambda family phage portal protein